ncbi:TonB-dependent siderophore receptor [Aquirhabdus parva]|uniref:TonB-dependent siderophore receptor n=2 Tax=Aquirhabdus parva TaxID=2283318 RepID=A0A345PB68_9GAMM|nr:TonB-dependent siderophore receptor [Aquirhabdus parva]
MLAMTLPSMAMAAESQESVLPTIKVEATKEKPVYQTKKVQSPKYTEPLRDTPQTITVVNKKAIEDQSLLSLREILSTVPGITFGAGEGGGGYGDKINIRGFNASNDITLDGLRESALFSRTDPFNIEQIEVVKGSNSAVSGSGAVGGSVNLVSKMPENKNFVDLGASLGTDHYYRTTVDANQKIDDTTAVRLNLMAHKNDVPGRDVEELKRWGFAPSITFGLGTPTRFTLSYLYQTDNNTPQYGVPYYNGRQVDGIDPANYYGYANVDKQKSTVNEITALFEHEFNDSLSVRNITRAAKVEQYTLVDPPQAAAGGLCLANGLAPSGWSQTASATGVITTNMSGYQSCAKGVTPGTYVPSGPRGNVRDTVNKLLTNQTDVTWKFNTAEIEHTLVTGLSLSHESFDLSTGNSFRNAGGALPNPVLPNINVYAPDTDYTGPLNYIQTSTTSGTLDNQAVYAFDTLKFNEHWLANVGVRYDHSEGESTALTYATPATGGAITAISPLKDKANTWSYKAGLVYKPIETASFYVSYGNSKTPSDATVTGTACTITAASATTAASSTCNVKPETAVTYEIGTKWDVLDSKLSLTAALFDTERSNYKVADPANPDNPTGTQTLDGSARVRGLELGAAGLITHNWSVFANLTAQRSKVLQGASDFVAAGGVNGTQGDFTKGDPLLNVPELAASVWTTYDVTRKLQLGYGVTYTGPMYLTQHAGILVDGTGVVVNGKLVPAAYAGQTTIPLVQSQSIVMHNLAVTYKFNRQLSAQINVKNIFDKEYYTAIRNNGWAVPGDGRSAVLNLTYHF